MFQAIPHLMLRARPHLMLQARPHLMLQAIPHPIVVTISQFIDHMYQIFLQVSLNQAISYTRLIVIVLRIKRIAFHNRPLQQITCLQKFTSLRFDRELIQL